MIRASRRGVLKGAGAASALALPAGARAALGGASLVVFDSRLPESASFAAALRGPRIDLALADATLWADLRGDLPQLAGVEGLTGWSDWTAVRGELEARGFRLTAEAPVRAALSGKTHLFRWAMRAR